MPASNQSPRSSGQTWQGFRIVESLTKVSLGHAPINWRVRSLYARVRAGSVQRSGFNTMTRRRHHPITLLACAGLIAGGFAIPAGSLAQEHRAQRNTRMVRAPIGDVGMSRAN